MDPACEVGKSIDINIKIVNTLLGEHLGVYSWIYEITPTVSHILCTDNVTHIHIHSIIRRFL